MEITGRTPEGYEVRQYGRGDVKEEVLSHTSQYYVTEFWLLQTVLEELDEEVNRCLNKGEDSKHYAEWIGKTKATELTVDEVKGMTGYQEVRKWAKRQDLGEGYRVEINKDKNQRIRVRIHYREEYVKEAGE